MLSCVEDIFFQCLLLLLHPRNIGIVIPISDCSAGKSLDDTRARYVVVCFFKRGSPLLFPSSCNKTYEVDAIVVTKFFDKMIRGNPPLAATLL